MFVTGFSSATRGGAMWLVLFGFCVVRNT
jgi:hypothetical protein